MNKMKCACHPRQQNRVAVPRVGAKVIAFMGLLVIFVMGSAASAVDSKTDDGPAAAGSTDTKTVAAKTVAGKTVDQYAAELDSENRVIRTRAAKSLSAFGVAGAKPLTGALRHSDPAVRYIASATLGRIGGEPLNAARGVIENLFKSDESASVRTAAAYALCSAAIQQTDAKPLAAKDPAMAYLLNRLRYPDRGTVCSTAELIGALGTDAGAAVDELEKVHAANLFGGRGDYHIGGATKNALRKIVPGWDKK